jgi:glutamine synthetase
LTFGPTAGVLPADTMVLLRSAIKQICQRAGYHATFMCRPKIPNVMSSGWHLHQSLRRKSDGVNAFMPEAGPGPESHSACTTSAA